MNEREALALELRARFMAGSHRKLWHELGDFEQKPWLRVADYVCEIAGWSHPEDVRNEAGRHYTETCNGECLDEKSR